MYVHAASTSFTTSLTTYAFDNIPPTVPTGLTATPISQSQIDLSWLPSTDNNLVGGYVVYRDDGAIATTSGTTFSDTLLSASTTYTYSVQAFDGSSNYSATSTSVSTTTLPVPVVIISTSTPPVSGGSTSSGGSAFITDLTVTPHTVDSVINFNTASPARSTVSWGLTPDLEAGSITSIFYDTTHEITITGLTADTHYYVRISVVGAQGVQSSVDSQFNTISLNPISILNPSNFTATPKGLGQNGINLSWTNPIDPRFGSVRVVRSTTFFPRDQYDGVPVYQGAGQNFFDASTVPGTRYYYSIFAEATDGSFSSGVLAQARIGIVGEIIPANNNPFTQAPPASNVNPLIANLTISDFEFIQNGKFLTPNTNNVISIDGTKNLTIRLAYNKVPEILKTIAVSLTDPKDSSKAFIFLLRANANKSYYEANVGSLGVSGDFPLAISILDYQNQSLKQIAGSLVAAVGDIAISSDQFGQLSFWLIIILLIVLLVIVVRILAKKNKKDNSKGSDNVTVVTSAVIALVILSGAMFFGIHQAYAFNQQINYQGKLANASNISVANGQYPIVFKLYTTSSTTTPIWTETDFGANQPTVSGGLFSIMLGSTTPFTGVDFNQTLYLGVTVASDTEMTPRKVIGAVPAAFLAGTSTIALSANTLQGITPGQFFRNDQQNATSSAATFLSILQTGAGKVAEFFASAGQSALAILSNGNVGVGSSTPVATLSVTGTSTAGVNPFIVASSSGATLLTVLQNGNVGVGTANPKFQLHVLESGQPSTNNPIDVMAVEVGSPSSGTATGYGPAILFKDIGTNVTNMARIGAVYEPNGTNNLGGLIFSTNSDTNNSLTLPSEKMRITAFGNVGIGTSSPIASLTVVSSTTAQISFVVASSSGTQLLTLFGNGNFGLGSTSLSNLFTVAGNGFFNGNVTATNIIATGTLNVSGQTTLGNATITNASTTNLAVTGLANTVLSVNALGQVVATSTAGFGTNYFSNSGATTTNNFANLASTLGVFGTIQATSTTGTSTFAGASIFTGNVGIGTTSPMGGFAFQGFNASTSATTNFAVYAGNGYSNAGTNGPGSSIAFVTGSAGSGSVGYAGGDFNVTTGSGVSSNAPGRGGNIAFSLGAGGIAGPAGGVGGTFAVVSGNGGASSATQPTGVGGAVTLTAGNGGAQTGSGSSAAGGALTLTAGNGGNTTLNGSPSGTGGTITFTAGNAGTVSSSTLAGGNGGNIILIPGTATATGTPGYVGIGTTSPSNLLTVAGNGFFNGNITATNITATGTLSVTGQTTLSGQTFLVNASTTNFSASGFANVTGTTTTGGLSVASLNGVLFGTNGAITAIATSSLGIPNFWTLSGATTTNTVANVASTLGVFGSVQATSTTGINTFAGTVGIGTSSPSYPFTVASQTVTTVVTGGTSNLNIGSDIEGITQRQISSSATQNYITLNLLASSQNTVAGGPTNQTTYGLYSKAFSSNQASISNNTYYGAYLEASGANAGATTVTDYGLYANAISTSTNATNYAVYANAANGSQNYGIYSAAGTNYFNGNVGIGTTSPSNLLTVAGNGFFSGNITATNITATGTLSVTGQTTLGNASTTNITVSNNLNVTSTTTTTGLKIASLSGVLFGTNGVITAIATSSLGIPNYWTQSGATTTNTVANVASTLGVFGTIQATSTTGTSTFASSAIFNGRVGIGTTTPAESLTIYKGTTNVSTLISDNGVLFTRSYDGLASAGVYYTGNTFMTSDGEVILYPGNRTAVDTINDSSVGKAAISGAVTLGGANLQVIGSLAVGGTYASLLTTPANGAIFQGTVGVGTSSPSTSNALEVGGNGYFAGNITGANLIATSTLTVSGQTTLANASTTNLSASGFLKVTGQTTLGNATITNASTTNLAITGLNSAILSVNALGQVVATTSGSGTNYFSNSGATTTLTTGTNLVAALFAAPYFLATSTTATSSIAGNFSVTGPSIFGGQLTIGNGNVNTDYGVSITNLNAGSSAAADISFVNNSGGNAYVGVGSSGTAAAYASRAFFDTFTGSGTSILSSASGGDVRFYTAGAAAGNERMRIGNTGNVGIGTTTASNLLEVAGNGYFAGNLTAANITATGTLNVTGKTTLAAASTTALTVANNLFVNGKIGINDPNPAPFIDINQNGSNPGLVMQSTAPCGTYGSYNTGNARFEGGTDNGGNIQFESQRGTAGCAQAGAMYWDWGWDNGGDFNLRLAMFDDHTFQVYDNGSGTTTVWSFQQRGGTVFNYATSTIFTGGGNVGIGTTTPTASNILTVAGNEFVNGNITATNITATGTLNVTGQTTLGNATITNASTTNLAITGLNSTILSVNALGQVVATTTSAGTNFFSNSGATTTLSTGSNLVAALFAAPYFMATSTTATSTFAGAFGIGSSTPSAANILTVAGNGFFTGNITGANLIATGNLTVSGNSTLATTSATSLSSTGSLTVGPTNLTATNNSFAFGYAPGTSAITATGTGSLAFGQAVFAGSKASIIANNTGSFAGGFALGNGGSPTILSSGAGSLAFGNTGSTRNITSSGSGSIAMGLTTSGNLTATGNASVAIGQDVNATANNAFALGSSFTNATASTFQVGFSATPILTVTNTSIGIGTTSPSNALEVAGNGYFTGNLTGTNITATGTLAVLGQTTLVNASTTNISASGFANVTGTTTTGGLSVGSLNGLLFGTSGAVTATTSISNSYLANSTISGISLGQNLANLTATNSTLTFSGSYNGGTAQTVGLNLSNTNTWSALQTFSNGIMSTASSTFTNITIGQSTTTNATTTSLAITGLSNTVLSVNALGQVVATTTSAGTNFFSNSGATTTLSTGSNLVAALFAAPYFLATSTTATSSIAGNLTVDGGTFTINSIANLVGIGTANPTAAFSVQAGTNTMPFFVASSSGAQLLTLLQNGNFGIGTSTPIASFSFQGVGQSTTTSANSYSFVVNGGNGVNVAGAGGNGGGVLFNTGNGLTAGTSGTGGDFAVNTGNGGGVNRGGNMTFTLGNGGGTSSNGGAFSLTAGNGGGAAGPPSGPGGAVTITAGNGGAQGGGSSGALAGVLTLNGGNAGSVTSGGVNGGNIILMPGLGSGTGLRGLVGIGSSTPSAMLSVLAATNTIPFVVASSSGAQLLTLLQNGNFGIGTSSPSNMLEVAGNGYFAGNITATNITATGTLNVTGQTTLGNANITNSTTTNATTTNLAITGLNSVILSVNALGQVVATTSGSGTNYFSNSGATTTLSTGSNLVAALFAAPYFLATSSTATSNFGGNATVGTTSLVSASNNSFALGDIYSANAGSTYSVVSSGGGSFAGGAVQTPAGTATSTILSSGPGSFAFGISVGVSGGTSKITSSGAGSVALGYSSGTTAGTGLISASGNGSFAGGYMSNTGSGTASTTASGIGAFAWGTGVGAYQTLSTAFGSGYVNNTANSFMVGYSAIPTLTVNSTSVGIGTTSPSNTLSVAGNSFINGNETATNITATGTLTVSGLTTLGNASTTSFTSTGPTFLATGGGNVGIGTAAPAYPFSVQGSIVDDLSFMQNTNVSGWSTMVLANSNATIKTSFGIGNASASTFANTAFFDVFAGGAPFVLATNDTERMRIENGGNIDIGTTSSSNLLSVGGNGFFTGNLTAANMIATGTLIVSGQTTLGKTIMSNSTTTNATTTNLAITGLNSVILSVNALGQVVATTSGSGTNYFSNSGATTTLSTGSNLVAALFAAPYFTATSTTATSTFAGNVFVGPTNPNFYPASPLVVTTNTNNYGQFVVQNLNSGNNASGDLIVGGDKMTDTSYYGDLGCNSSTFNQVGQTILPAFDCYLYSSDSNLDIGTASTTGPSNINFFTGGTLAANNRMTILTNGNVGIGTTSPSSLNLLTVAGNGFFNGSLTAGTLNAASTTGTSTIAGNLVVGPSSGTTGFMMDANGNVGIGTSTLSNILEVAGNGYFAGNLTGANITATGTLAAISNIALGTSTYSFVDGIAMDYIQAASGNGRISVGPSDSLSFYNGGLGNTRLGYFDPNGNFYSNTINATSTTGTSTFAGNLTVDGGTLTVNSINNTVGINTTNSNATLGIKGSSGTNPFVIASSSATVAFNMLTLNQAGDFGIGSSSPSANLSIQDNSGLAGTNPLFIIASSTLTGTATTTLLSLFGNGNFALGTTSPSNIFTAVGNGYFSGNLTAANMIATGTITQLGTGTSTFAGGLNVDSGTFIVNPTTNTVGINTTNSNVTLNVKGTAGFNPFVIATSSATVAFNMLTLNQAGSFGIGTSTPAAKLSIQDNSGLAATNPLFVIASSTLTGTATTTLLTLLGNGNFALGSTTPSGIFTAVGNGYFSGSLTAGAITATSTLTVVGNTSLQNASTTNLSVSGFFRQTGTSGTNPFVIASSSATQFSMLALLQNGFLGIGSSTPGSKLSIQDNSGAATSTGLFTIASSTSAGAATTTLFTVTGGGYVGIGTTTLVSTFTVAGSACFASTTQAGAKTVCGTRTGNIYYDTANPGNYDVAENYQTSDPSISAGDIVSADPSRPKNILRATTGSRVLGVISTQPGELLGGSSPDILTATMRPVALSGRIPAKVSTENGPIAIGDSIALSSVAGIGMKASGSGERVGIALESYSGNGVGVIDIFANLGQNVDLNQFALASSTNASTTVIADELTVALASIQSLQGQTNNLNNQFTAFSSSTSNFISSVSSTTAAALASSTSFVQTIADAVVSILNASGQVINSAGKWTVGEITALTGTFNKVIAGRVETQTAAVSNGIEMSSPNGQLWCVRIDNTGNFVRTTGSCDTSASTTPVTNTPITTGQSNTAPVVTNNQPTSTTTVTSAPVNSTSTDNTSSNTTNPTTSSSTSSTPVVTSTPAPAPTTTTAPDTTVTPASTSPTPTTSTTPAPVVTPAPAPTVTTAVAPDPTTSTSATPPTTSP